MYPHSKSVDTLFCYNPPPLAGLAIRPGHGLFLTTLQVCQIVFDFVYLYLSILSAALIRRPMFTQSLTAATLFGAGDIIAQQVIEQRGPNHDVRLSRISVHPVSSLGSSSCAPLGSLSTEVCFVPVLMIH